MCWVDKYNTTEFTIQKSGDNGRVISSMRSLQSKTFSRVVMDEVIVLVIPHRWIKGGWGFGGWRAVVTNDWYNMNKQNALLEIGKNLISLLSSTKK